MKKRLALFCLGATLAAAPVLADWEVAAGSQIQFVSIKNNAIGEVSHFETLSGTVTEAGEVEVRVALDSVETNIGIRNERMKKLLFEVGLYPEAVITAQLDPAEMVAVASGVGNLMTATLQIDLHGQMVNKRAALTIAATDSGLSVTTVEPILLNASEFKLEGGVAALQQIAGLNAISRVIPVTVALQLSSVDAASP
jgi:polyisoprenoid-binding protein YceI